MDFSLELGTEVLPQTRLALQTMLSDLCADWIARRSQRWSGKDDLATGAHPVFSEVTLHSSSQRRLFTT
jgi:hypothetical protein